MEGEYKIVGIVMKRIEELNEVIYVQISRNDTTGDWICRELKKRPTEGDIIDYTHFEKNLSDQEYFGDVERIIHTKELELKDAAEMLDEQTQQELRDLKQNRQRRVIWQIQTEKENKTIIKVIAVRSHKGTKFEVKEEHVVSPAVAVSKSLTLAFASSFWSEVWPKVRKLLKED